MEKGERRGMEKEMRTVGGKSLRLATRGTPDVAAPGERFVFFSVRLRTDEGADGEGDAPLMGEGAGRDEWMK